MKTILIDVVISVPIRVRVPVAALGDSRDLHHEVNRNLSRLLDDEEAFGREVYDGACEAYSYKIPQEEPPK